jgi:hypothetical protein
MQVFLFRVCSLNLKINFSQCINYWSVRQAPAYYWQYFDFMLKRALEENSNTICLGDLNINFMANIPTNIWDIIFINVKLTLLIN